MKHSPRITVKILHLFITGVGNVGSNLIKQIHDQKNHRGKLKFKTKSYGLI